MSPKRVGMRLKELREEEEGLTQEALAKRIPMSRAYLSRLEMGLHEPPLSKLQAIAKALGVKVGRLLE